jgi:hypothetical protein
MRQLKSSGSNKQEQLKGAEFPEILKLFFAFEVGGHF